MDLEAKDEDFMREALKEASKGLGRTSPNPAVGAVIVREGRIVARGFHHRAGSLHAEIEALNRLKDPRVNDTLYVTLEPCNHYGKQPPCTEAILKSGIGRVVVGMKDPNPMVTGGGSEFLKRHGVSVTEGVLEKECRKLNESFIKFVTSKHPFVIIKSALTIDGWTATSTGHSKWITNEKSRAFVHHLRNMADAVMVGVGTVLSDDPMLTVRSVRGEVKDPVRIIVDTHLRTPSNSNVVNHTSSAKTIIAVGADEVSEERCSLFTQKKGVSLLFCPVKDGRIDLKAMMSLLADMDIMSVLVEGGASLVGSLLRERIPDKFYIFKAPKILGGDDGFPMASGPGPRTMKDCLNLKDINLMRFDDDIMIEGYPDWVN